MSASAQPIEIWRPQEGPQEALVACPVFEVFYGGARGGGKTDGSLGDWLSHSGTYGEAATGVFFRRTFKQLSEVIARSHQIYSKIGARWTGDKGQWVMPGGARLLFRYLERDSDAEEYQGHNYTRVYIEEATNFPSPKPIDKLKATLRSATGVPTGIRLTGNPGGPGHGWVKKRYIDPAPQGFKVIFEEFENPFTHEKISLDRVFIPSKLKDNILLMKNDPLYVAKLQTTGGKQLVEAWLLGNWDIIDGAFFAELVVDPSLPNSHVLADSWLANVPPYSLCFRAFDWGYAKPFSCGWYVVSDGSWGLPRGALLKFHEWYGSNGRPNEGLRLDAGPVAEGIREREQILYDQLGLRPTYGVADPSIFTRDGGPSIAEEMMRQGIMWVKADNKRLPGWQQMRRRLVGNGGKPMLYFLESCADTVRTLPLLQHDESDAEDLDTDGEDHAADETRYACMSRPWAKDDPSAPALAPPPVKLPGQLTFNDVLAMNRARRLREESV